MSCTSKKLAASFRRNVRERMAEIGINQQGLADRLRVGKSYVSQVLGGHRGPGLEAISSFAVALNVEPADLIREKKFAKSA